MLSEVEKNGIRSLLHRLTKEDLISLTDTVTNRAVTVETSKGIDQYFDVFILTNISLAEVPYIYLICIYNLHHKNMMYNI